MYGQTTETFQSCPCSLLHAPCSNIHRGNIERVSWDSVSIMSVVRVESNLLTHGPGRRGKERKSKMAAAACLPRTPTTNLGGVSTGNHEPTPRCHRNSARLICQIAPPHVPLVASPTREPGRRPAVAATNVQSTCRAVGLFHRHSHGQKSSVLGT